MGKHSYESKHIRSEKVKKEHTKSNKKFSKIIFITIIIILICTFGYLFFKNRKTETKEPTITDIFYNTSSSTALSDKLKIEQDKDIEVQGIHISKKDDNYTLLFSNVKNTSSEEKNNLNFRLFLLDEHEETINYLDYTLDTIKANDSVSIQATITDNLENCKYYSVALQK